MGRLRKTYIPRSEVKNLRQRIRYAKAKEVEEKRIIKIWTDHFKQLLEANDTNRKRNK